MGVIVETESGKIEGERRGGHERFLGIPFAAPPVGERRWRAPEAAPLWSRVRPALQFGPSAPQRRAPCPHGRRRAGRGLLVSQRLHPERRWRARPVMFWIHGGGFTTGSGSQALYDGGRLAERATSWSSRSTTDSARSVSPLAGL